MRSVRAGVRCVPPALAVTLLLTLAVSIAEEAPTYAMVQAQRAQAVVAELALALSITHNVELAIVAHHPLVFSVERVPLEDRFKLSIELGFIMTLEEDELRAALAHELGHVWIFTHHPYLHTERLANEIGLRVVKRDALERVYTKLWKYEGSAGVPLERLLGPPQTQNAELLLEGEAS